MKAQESEAKNVDDDRFVIPRLAPVRLITGHTSGSTEHTSNAEPTPKWLPMSSNNARQPAAITADTATNPGATSNTIIDVISPHPALAYTIMGLHGPSESLNVGYSTGKRSISSIFTETDLILST